VAVDAGWREKRGQAVQGLQGRQAQGGAAGQVGRREEVENLVGTVADQVEPVEGEGRPGTIPNEPLKAGAVGSLDTDAAVKAEPATVIPGQHVLGVVGLQEVVATDVEEDSFAYRALEAFQKLGCEGGGFVEAEADGRIGRILAQITPEFLKESVGHAQVVMKVGVQGEGP
jgi:hypothetical protein